MADAESTVLLKVKADTSQAVKETDKLTGSQQKLASAVDQTTSKFSRMVEGGRGAFSGFGEAIRSLNQGLEIIEKVTRAVTKAVDSQLIERAGKFGANIKNAADAADKLHEVLKKTPNALDDTTKELLKTHDAFEDLGKSINHLIAEVAVPLVNVLVDKVNDLVEYGSDFIDLISNGAVRERRLAEDALRTQIVHRQGIEFYSDLTDAAHAGPYDLAYTHGHGLSDTEYLNQIYGNIGGTPGVAAPGSLAYLNNKKNAIPVKVVEIDPNAGGQRGGVFGAGRDIEGSITGGYAMQNNNRLGAVGSADGITFSRPGGLFGLYGGESFSGSSDLAKMADPLASLKEQLGDQTSAAGATFAALSAGITSAVDAAISGNEAIGKSAAKASAAVLKSISIEATGRAVFEGALAIGALAMGNPKDAAMHGIAAAKYAAAAAVTGTLAAGLGSIAGGGAGSSAGGASAGAPAGGFGAATGGSGGGGPISVTVNVGYGFSGDSRQIEDAVRRGVRAAQVRGGRSNYATEVSG